MSEKVTVSQAIAGRRSIRKYRPEQIREEELNAILTAGMLAPSAANRQPWHFIVIQNRVLIEQLSDAVRDAMLRNPSGSASASASRTGYAPLFHAPTVILVCGKEGNSWSRGDCGLAAQNMALAAYERGIGSCMVGFILNLFGDHAGDQSALIQKLRIPEGYELYYAFCFGYPDESPAARKRDFDDKVTYIL